MFSDLSLHHSNMTTHSYIITGCLYIYHMLLKPFCWIMFSNMQASFSKEVAPQFIFFRLLLAVGIHSCFLVYRCSCIFAIWSMKTSYYFSLLIENLLKVTLSFGSVSEQKSKKKRKKQKQNFSRGLLCHAFSCLYADKIWRSLLKGYW